MSDLQRHELMSLLYDKIVSIRDLCEQGEGESNLANLRHALGEIKRISARACKLIDDFEPCRDTSLCTLCQRVDSVEASS